MGVTVTISLLLLAITGIIVKEYIDNSEYTCTSLTWTFLRICHVTMSIWLVVISTVVTQKTNIALKGADKMKRNKVMSDIKLNKFIYTKTFIVLESFGSLH